MSPGDVVVGVLAGAQETKVRPAVVIARTTYLAERPDVLLGILTTKFPKALGSTDYILVDWRIGRTPRGVLLPSIRTDDASLGIGGDRSSERARLGVR